MFFLMSSNSQSYAHFIFIETIESNHFHKSRSAKSIIVVSVSLSLERNHVKYKAMETHKLTSETKTYRNLNKFTDINMTN